MISSISNLSKIKGLAYSCQPETLTLTRHFTDSFKKDVSELFSIPKLMHPDLYHEHEAKAWAQHRGGLGKTLSQYYRPRPYNSWSGEGEGISWNWWKEDYEGWEEAEWRSRFWWNRLEANRICFFSLAGFSQKAVKLEAISIYAKVSEAIANPTKLKDVKHLLSAPLYGQLVGQSHRFSSHQVDWQMVKGPSLSDVKLVDGKLGKPNPSPNSQFNSKLGFIQWTVEVHSEQLFALYNKKGNQKQLVSGDPTKTIKVIDYWVIERPIFVGWIPRVGPRGASWTLIDRLNVPPNTRPPPPKLPAKS